MYLTIVVPSMRIIVYSNHNKHLSLGTLERVDKTLKLVFLGWSKITI